MNLSSKMQLGIFAIAAAFTTSPMLAEAAEQSIDKRQQAYERAYKIRFLNEHDAEVLAWDICEQTPDSYCRVLSSSGGSLIVLADVDSHRNLVQALAEKDLIPRDRVKTQSFQITLLIAEAGSEFSADQVPPNVVQALQEIVDFLPYRSFQFLDMAWLRSTQSASARLRGPGTKEFAVNIHFRHLGSPAEGNILIERFTLDASEQAMASTPQPENDAGSSVGVAPQADKRVLSTSLQINVGETVVVGTSKLNGGNDALIVLITAVPQ